MFFFEIQAISMNFWLFYKEYVDILFSLIGTFYLTRTLSIQYWCTQLVIPLQSRLPSIYAGNKAFTFIGLSNTFTITLNPKLLYTPSSCFLGINGYNNLITSGSLDIKFQSEAHTFSMTAFELTVNVTRPNSYSLISYSYAFFDPLWNYLQFYRTGYISTSLITIIPDMIGNQPVSYVKDFCLSSL